MDQCFCVANSKIATKICALQHWKLNFQTAKTCRNFLRVFFKDIDSSVRNQDGAVATWFKKVLLTSSETANYRGVDY